MKIRIDVASIPEALWESMANAVAAKLTKKYVQFDRTPKTGYISCTLFDGTIEDVERLRSQGFRVKVVKSKGR